MSEIRCPMCSKPNPAELEVCQFCQARLKPLIYSPPIGSEGESPMPMDREGEPSLTERKEEPTSSAGEDSLEDRPSHEEKLPEWLRRFQPQEGSGEDAHAADDRVDDAARETESTGEPDWLDDLRLQEGAQADFFTLEDQEEEGAPSSETEEAPDWLHRIRMRQEEEDSSTAFAPEEADDDRVDFSAESGQQEEPGIAEPAEQPAEEAALPAWLEPGSDQIPEEDEPDSAFELSGLSNWQDQQSQDPTSEDEGDPFPEWSLEEAGEGDVSEREASFSPDIMDWTGMETEEPGETNQAEEVPGLEHAELPSWLEAMRPVEDVAASVPYQESAPEELEKAGPLAGLRGILSAEPEIARLQPPTTHSLKLRISAAQRAHADLLKSILEEEGEARQIPRRPAISPLHLLRWAIALVLFLAVLWSILSTGQPGETFSFSEETMATSQLIEGLPAEARALLVFDYEPGLSSEMDAAAATVVDHLMLRGAYLTLVSTSPTGPILAERFLAGMVGSHNYIRNRQYANLGYLAGGPSGMLSLVENPRRTLPYTLDGVVAWGDSGSSILPPLAGITKVSDFDLVMVLADDALTSRAWVEQVQPHLSDGEQTTPLVMVISAQAEPLIRPFYEANPRQVQGFVAGLRGGMAYARLTGRASFAESYWKPFGVGLSVAGLIIVISVLVGAAATLINRPPRQPKPQQVEESQ